MLLIRRLVFQHCDPLTFLVQCMGQFIQRSTLIQHADKLGFHCLSLFLVIGFGIRWCLINAHWYIRHPVKQTEHSTKISMISNYLFIKSTHLKTTLHVCKRCNGEKSDWKSSCGINTNTYEKLQKGIAQIVFNVYLRNSLSISTPHLQTIFHLNHAFISLNLHIKEVSS